MLASLHLLLLVLLAYGLRSRFALLGGFCGLPRFLLSIGLTLFFCKWAYFSAYVLLGWGSDYLVCTWSLLGLMVVRFWPWRRPASLAGELQSARAALCSPRTWNYALFALIGWVLARAIAGVSVDEEGSVWATFNYDDTAIHLSVANAFLNDPQFPPMDLDAAAYPLKYHFIADFYLAHLQRLGWPALRSVLAMNWIGAAVLVGAIWAGMERWLRLSRRWVLLACLIFLFLNTSLVNALHHLCFKPEYFNPQNFFDGVMMYPYFNFESAMTNLFAPQRALLFAFPAIVLVLNALFGESWLTGERLDRNGTRVLLKAFAIVCLLPFAHIVAFAVLGACLAPVLWRYRREFFSHSLIWVPLVVVAGLQLFYLFGYGPPTHDRFSGWDVGRILPLQEYQALPAVLRRVVFWLFVDGDFLFWGLLFLALPFYHQLRRRSLGSLEQLRILIVRWRWYLLVCFGAFLGINFYRYSASWGDSNKFVLFLNLGLTLVIVAGIAHHPSRWVSGGLAAFFFALTVLPHAYDYYRKIVVAPHGTVLMFHKFGLDAADWLKANSAPSDVVITMSGGIMHFPTALAGRPVPSGIYGTDNLYYRDERAEAIRRLYEDGDLQVLRELKARYVCISRHERFEYRLHPRWNEWSRTGKAVAFRAGHLDDPYSVVLFDARELQH